MFVCFFSFDLIPKVEFLQPYFISSWMTDFFLLPFFFLSQKVITRGLEIKGGKRFPLSRLQKVSVLTLQDDCLRIFRDINQMLIQRTCKTFKERKKEKHKLINLKLFIYKKKKIRHDLSLKSILCQYSKRNKTCQRVWVGCKCGWK